MNFEYPIKIRDERSSGNVDHLKGGRNQTGFFPIGRLNNWHGGLHIDGNNRILAIADGRVIAYRFPLEYLTDKDDCKYSNGFVLIQHDYQSPKGLKLTFYSLYNHLLPFKEIRNSKDAPEFIPTKVFELKGMEIKGGVTGENVRYLKRTGEYEEMAFLRNGSRVKVVAENNKRYSKFTLVTGALEQVNSDFENEETYIFKDSIFPIVTEDATSNEIKIVDIEVKAGDLIGSTGNFGFDRKPIYQTAHIEVFSADEVSAFLKGNQEDIDETLYQYRIPKGTELQKKYPGKIASGWNVKVVQEDTDYSQIELSPVEAEVLYSDLIDTHAKENINGEKKSYYTLKTGESFNRLNTAFNNLLSAEMHLYYKAMVGSTKRKVLLFSLDTKKYWIKTSALPAGETTIRSLSSDLLELYLEKPEELTETVDRDVFVRAKDNEKFIDANQIEWRFIDVSYYFNATTVKKKGWIKTSEIDKVSAHNWETFGFKLMDDLEDKYIYDINNTPAFLKNLLKEIDTVENEVEIDDQYKWEEADKKGKLTAGELRRGLRKTPIVDGLSKLVCKHTNEWDYKEKFDSLKSEIIILTDPDIIGKANETDLKTKRDERLEVIKDRIEKLSFWKEVADKISVQAPATTSPATSTPASSEADAKPPVVFPSSSMVYHFHPIAFVEQMKRHNVCFCNRDITVEAFEEIFGKGPWFTGKLGIVDMQRDYPDVYNVSTQTLVKELNRAMKDYGVKTCLQKAHFLGQIGGETGFQFTAECDDGADYDPGSHKALHDNYIDYCVFLKKYSGLATSQKCSEHEAKIDTQFGIYKKAYEKYKKASEVQKSTNEYEELKDMHTKYPTFKTEKEKYDSIYANSYHYSSKNTTYQNWTHSYNRYATCINRGNTEIGDGKKYRGHGMLQLTWKDNYEEFKKRLKIDIVSNSELLSSNITNACNMAGSWWKSPLTGAGNLNKRADVDDMIYVGYGINGGLNGLAHRYKYTRKAIDNLGCKECANYKLSNLGDYTYENSKIKKIYKKDDDVDNIKQILKNAKKNYEVQKK